MKILQVAYKVLIALIVARLHTVHTACSVPMNGGLPDPQPLILTPDGSRDVFGFKLPADNGNLLFTSGEEVRLVCLGPSNSFVNLPNSQQDIRVRCDTDTTFLHDGEARNLSFFACSQVPLSATRRSATRCSNERGRIFEIGFEITTTNEFFKVIEVCFDERKMNSVWSKIDIVSVIAGRQFGFDSGGTALTAGSFYPGLDPDNLYTLPTQTYNVGRIIGKLQADHFINSTYYLTTGLLSDGANFVYKSQQLTTMHFINSAPQWNFLKAGVWGVIEKHVRYYAHDRGVDLIVYTGTHGVTTLPDGAKVPNKRELYLSIKNRTKQMAVPAVFWKVVYEPVSKKAVAMVTINNPYKDRTVLEVERERYNLCARKAYISRWYICAAVDLGAGFGYCCEVDEFRRFVTSLPAFQVTGLLT